jgi:ankyrin repeat protein
MIAASSGSATNVAALIEHGADEGLLDSSGLTASAHNDEHDDEVSLLLGGENMQRLRWAVEQGRERLVALLLGRGVQPPVEVGGSTLLHVASRRGHVKVALELLDRGAALEARTSAGETPLLSASGTGQVQVVKLLLERGASIAAVDTKGRTALHLASSEGHQQTLQLLLTKDGAAVHARMHHGFTPLHVACEHGMATAASMLLAAGADARASSETGLTALHLATRGDHVNSMRVILQSGPVNIDARTVEGITPLMLACELGFGKAAMLLIGIGADLHAVNAAGKSIAEITALALSQAANAECEAGASQIASMLDWHGLRVVEEAEETTAADA